MEKSNSVRNTAFQESWLSEKEFQGWLKKGSKETKAKCGLCHKEFDLSSMGRRAVTSHAASQSHRKNAENLKNQPSLNFPTAANGDSRNDGAIKSELRLLLFFVEHNVAFNCLDHSGFVKTMCPDSKNAQNMAIKRTKGSYLLNDALSPCIETDLHQTLKDTPFCLCIDESNEMGNRKFLEIVVTYISEQNSNIIQSHLKLSEIPDGKAATILESVKNVIKDSDLSLQNLLSCMTDSPNVMVGEKKGFIALLKRDAPHILDTGRCTLHHVSNAVKYACDVLDNLVENFADDVSSYFMFSSRWTSYSGVSIFSLLHNRFKGLQTFQIVKPCIIMPL